MQLADFVYIGGELHDVHLENQFPLEINKILISPSEKHIGL